MWSRPPIKAAEEHINDLIKCHDEIKTHPFRKHFQDDQETGTFKAMFNEYRKLIYDSTDILIALHYYCADEPMLTRDDLEWVHDFRQFLLCLYNYYVYEHKGNRRFERFDTPTKGSSLTYREILTRTGITDINTVMIYLDKYLGYIHRFIETRAFDVITAIKYERVTNPHNGYYYYHLSEMVKVNGVWKFKEEAEMDAKLTC